MKRRPKLSKQFSFRMTPHWVTRIERLAVLEHNLVAATARRLLIDAVVREEQARAADARSATPR